MTELHSAEVLQKIEEDSGVERERGFNRIGLASLLLIAASLVAALCLPWLDGLSPAEWLLGAVVEAAVAVPAWLAVV